MAGENKGDESESMNESSCPFVSLVSVVVMLVSLNPTPAHAQNAAGPVPRTPKPAVETGEVNLTAVSANVSESGSPVKIRILRWSTDEERSPVVAALTPSPPPVTAPADVAAGAPAEAGSSPGAAANPPAAGDRGGGARGGRGAAGTAGRAGRAGAAGRGGRGAGGRGGRGGAGGAVNPIAALTAAIDKAPTLGYIWTRDITGYAIKYAYHVPLPDGGERIILATNRRLGADSPAWNPVAAPTVTDYEFTLIEIRLDAKGRGEGKTSVTTKVVVDNEARTLALENYAATPGFLQNVSR